MTAEEAMERANECGTRNVECLMEALRSGGSQADVKRSVGKATKRWAAALIRAQIDGLEYAYLNADFVPIGARLNECRAALAKLEAERG